MSWARLFLVIVLSLLAGVQPPAQAQFVVLPGPAELLRQIAARAAYENRPFVNGDFEQGLEGWEATGDAFESQPTLGDNVTPMRLGLVTLGGDYWRAAMVRVGHSGQNWIGTYERRPDTGHVSGTVQGDGPTGTLTSGIFDLDDAHHFVSFMIGGGASGVGVELQVRGGTPAESDAFAAQIARDTRVAPANVERVGQWTVARTDVASNAEPMRQVVIDIPAAWRGRGLKGRIAIVDNSSGGWGHINVDDIRIGPGWPAPRVAPLWGYADLHTHPMAHIGPRANLIWGSPGGRLADYARDPRRIEQDLPPCDGFAHYNRGPIAGYVLAGIESRISAYADPIWTGVEQLFNAHSHGVVGPPSFIVWPDFRAGAHQQMHITQIRRAYDGGLRLMSALVVANEALEYALSPVEGGEPRASKRILITPERNILLGQVCGMRRLAALNADWMEIAYSPADVRRIVGANKLAIVLGTEMPQLGTLGFASADAEVQYLYNLGIRQVTPIHAADNLLGGAAIFQDEYNTFNDYIHRPADQRDVDGERFRAGTHPPVTFFGVREGGCGQGPLAGQRGECVLYRLRPRPHVLTYDYTVFTGYRPGREEDASWHGYDYSRTALIGPQGQLNTMGLTAYGRDYIRALMARGMLIDLAHMSDRSIEGAIQASRRGLPARNRLCGDFRSSATMAAAPEECFAEAYPLMVSHVAFRAQSIQEDGTLAGTTRGTTVKSFLPREFELSDLQTELVRHGGGVIGVFIGPDPIDNPPGWRAPSRIDDCSGSATGFVQAFAYGVERMRGRGVAVASDFGFHPMLNPRFGPNACWIFNLAENPGLERERTPHHYQIGSQAAGVVYAGNIDAAFVTRGNNVPLIPYQLGNRFFSVNLDGLAHYGMIPDVLQDARNVGLDDARLDPLFRSAEDYVQMWEKAIRLSGAPVIHFTPAPIDCEAACRGRCP